MDDVKELAERLRNEAADMIEQQAAEIDRLRDRLEKIEAQATEGVVRGWVCIPAVEWEAITSDTRTEKELEGS